SEIRIHQVLEILLPAGARLRVDTFALDIRRQVIERALAGEDGAPFRTFPARIPLRYEAVHRPVLDHLFGDQQGARADVHRADVRVQQVLRIDRLATDLRVEVETARGEA